MVAGRWEGQGIKNIIPLSPAERSEAGGLTQTNKLGENIQPGLSSKEQSDGWRAQRAADACDEALRRANGEGQHNIHIMIT